MRLNVEGDKAEIMKKLGAGIAEGNRVALHPVEACYFADELGLSKEEAFREIKRLGLEHVFKVYEELRKKGYVLMFLDDDIRVLRKGFRRGEDRAYAIIKVVKASEPSSWAGVSRFVEYASGLRKNAVLAVVGENVHYIGLGNIRFD